MSFGIKLLISLCYVVVVLLVGCHVYNLFCDYRVLRISLVNLTVWSLYEAILIDSRIACK